MGQTSLVSSDPWSQGGGRWTADLPGVRPPWSQPPGLSVGAAGGSPHKASRGMLLSPWLGVPSWGLPALSLEVGTPALPQPLL
jgi:hypothetical protein